MSKAVVKAIKRDTFYLALLAVQRRSVTLKEGMWGNGKYKNNSQILLSLSQSESTVESTPVKDQFRSQLLEKIYYIVCFSICEERIADKSYIGSTEGPYSKRRLIKQKVLYAVR